MGSAFRKVESVIVQTYPNVRLRIVGDRELVHIYSEYELDGEWNHDCDAGVTFDRSRIGEISKALASLSPSLPTEDK